jgi:oxygen-independent coproporphyrinogen III oxidase
MQVPFCRTKCSYCNFHTGVFPQDLYAPYLDALCREILEHRRLYRDAGVDHSLATCTADWVVDTVYLGGGTPSLLPPASLARLLEAVRTSFACAFAEVTLEADPETVDGEKAAVWRAAGIDRISLGVQSFADRELRATGRLHRRPDIFAATAALRAAGFDNLSFDLIAGLPYQNADSWKSSLGELIALAPEHVSVYMLEIDEGSRLGCEALAGGTRYGVPSLPDEDAVASFYEAACEALSGAGYEHYEISNWGRPGRRSWHNLKYWNREAYLGFGAGAHSFAGSNRWSNAHDPVAYLAALNAGRLPVEQHEALTAAQVLDEELFLGLRLLEGIPRSVLEKRYNSEWKERLARLAAQGLLEFVGERVRLARGRLTVSNEVFVELMQSSERAG